MFCTGYTYYTINKFNKKSVVLEAATFIQIMKTHLRQNEVINDPTQERELKGQKL